MVTSVSTLHQQVPKITAKHFSNKQSVGKVRSLIVFREFAAVIIIFSPQTTGRNNDRSPRKFHFSLEIAKIFQATRKFTHYIVNFCKIDVFKTRNLISR
ncbi:hypothetical protein CDG77_02095 [Nostoc sp. 'Peltigera membranacea cyanobiont' 213]|nr:hypothetical protein CDG77_02095 [Nostoc sp. 'Peltigera membranacea cyanobiont' 213]